MKVRFYPNRDMDDAMGIIESWIPAIMNCYPIVVPVWVSGIDECPDVTGEVVVQPVSFEVTGTIMGLKLSLKHKDMEGEKLIVFELHEPEDYIPF